MPLCTFAFALTFREKKSRTSYATTSLQRNVSAEGMAVLPVDQEDRADDNGTISSQSFTSRGVGQRAEDSASDTMHSPRYIDN